MQTEIGRKLRGGNSCLAVPMYKIIGLNWVKLEWGGAGGG